MPSTFYQLGPDAEGRVGCVKCQKDVFRVEDVDHPIAVFACIYCSTAVLVAYTQTDCEEFFGVPCVNQPKQTRTYDGLPVMFPRSQGGYEG